MVLRGLRSTDWNEGCGERRGMKCGMGIKGVKGESHDYPFTKYTIIYKKQLFYSDFIVGLVNPHRIFH